MFDDHRQSRMLAERAWQRLRSGLLEASKLNEPWGRQYMPSNIGHVDHYVHSNLDRFCMLFEALQSRLPADASVLDAGAGYGIQAALFREGGFSVSASDIYLTLPIYEALGIDYRQWHLEGDPAPFEPEQFDAVLLSQTIEHFTYSPRHAIEELLRILKPGGWLLIDAPNISSLRNIWRLIRGKTIHWNLKKHYLEQSPVWHKGIPYYDRHNHEYAREDFADIADFFALNLVECRYYSPIDRSKPFPVRMFARVRDCVPPWRKGIYALFQKPERSEANEARPSAG